MVEHEGGLQGGCPLACDEVVVDLGVLELHAFGAAGGEAADDGVGAGYEGWYFGVALGLLCEQGDEWRQAACLGQWFVGLACEVDAPLQVLLGLCKGGGVVGEDGAEAGIYGDALCGFGGTLIFERVEQ